MLSHIQNDKINDDILKISTNDKHMKHILTNKRVEEMTMVQKVFPITGLPVCGHCEGLGFWGKVKVGNNMGTKTGTCWMCGTVTLNPVTYGEYLVAGYDLPDRMSFEEKEEIRTKRAVAISE